MPAKHRKLIVFCAIGVLNTAVDVTIYLVLRRANLPIVAANTISTAAALILSYSLNRKFTFKSTAKARSNIVPFLIVTLAGLWVLQPIVIHLALSVLRLPFAGSLLRQTGLSGSSSRDLLSKLAATPATLLWNYILYSKLVFRSQIAAKINTTIGNDE